MTIETNGVPAAGGESTDDISSPASAIESDVQWEELSDESTREADISLPAADAAADTDNGEDGQPAGDTPPTTGEGDPAPAGAQDLEGTQAGTGQPDDTPPPEDTPPPQVQLTPEQQAEQQRQWQEYQAQQMEQLEQYYAVNEEDALALATEPEKVLPKLAARLHMQVLSTVQQQMAQTMPNVMKTVQAATERESKAKETFYGAWPELKGHDQQVIQAGVMFRQMNPTATAQEAIDGIGRIVMAALGKQRVDGGKGNLPPAAGTKPNAPFRPASGTGGAQHRQPEKSVWSELAEDD